MSAALFAQSLMLEKEKTSPDVSLLLSLDIAKDALSRFMFVTQSKKHDSMQLFYFCHTASYGYSQNSGQQCRCFCLQSSNVQGHVVVSLL